MRKPIREFDLRNVSPDDFINQAKGLKLVKQRKRQEKKYSNESKFPIKIKITREMKGLDTRTKRQKVSDQIQRGFDIATKWKEDDAFLDEVIAIGMKELEDENKTKNNR